MTISEKLQQNFCEFFFHNQVEPEYLNYFETVTPHHNIISGLICEKPNEYFGSMIITHIQTKTNEFDTLQFVRGMSKIHCYNTGINLKQGNRYIEYNCYEKIDGTCLIFYPIFDNVNQLIEIIPRTQYSPVIDSYIYNMLKCLDVKNIQYYFEDNPDSVLIFELYGMLNKHKIQYVKTYINLVLLSVIKNNEFLYDTEVNLIAQMYHFDRPEMFYRIIYYNGFWRIFPKFTTSIKFYNNIHDSMKYSTQTEVINTLREALKEINNAFKKNNGRIYTEGIIINGIDENDEQVFIKIDL